MGVSIGVTGCEGTQQLVEAGAACVAARSVLSAAARYLLAQLPTQLSPPQSTNGTPITTASSTSTSSSNARSSCIDNQEDRRAGDAEGRVNGRRPGVAGAAAAAGAGESVALLSDLVWRYLELGARGRVCVAALRRSAREMAGDGGGGGKGGSSEGVGSSAGLGEEEGAAARLEEGLDAGEPRHELCGEAWTGRSRGGFVVYTRQTRLFTHVRSAGRLGCGLACVGHYKNSG